VNVSPQYSLDRRLGADLDAVEQIKDIDSAGNRTVVFQPVFRRYSDEAVPVLNLHRYDVTWWILKGSDNGI
jgi:hypothetical protein